MSDLATLAQLRRMRDSGIMTSTTDGVTVTFRSMAELQQAIIRLERELGMRKRRKGTNPVYMGRR